jgi:hypothetical protein
MGLIGTAVVRDQDLDAFTGGIDANIRWRQNRYALNNQYVVSRAPFGRELRNGFGGASNFSYVSRSLRINGHFDHFSRSFRNTDIGFIASRINKTNVNGAITLVQADPWRSLRNASIAINAGETRNGDGLGIGRSIGAIATMQLLNFWSANANVTYNFESLADLETRGGPPMVAPASTLWNASISSDPRRSWGTAVFASGSTNAVGGWSRMFESDWRFQPSAQLQASVSARYSAGVTVAQWITNRDVTGDGEIDHVFGRLRTDVIDLTARGTLAFSRDMTLEFYLQPFISVGDYSDIKRLARPRSFDFQPAAIANNPDFNNKSLLSNVVMRWEYREGSTLYLVWQMSGMNRSDPGVFEPWNDFGDSLGGPRSNIFMLKTTYWLGSVPSVR